jgi:uncharacterized RDD family membrane protein YckC
MNNPPSEHRPASLWRRTAALFYDSLFVFAVLMLATLILLPLHGGQAMPQTGPLAWAYQVYLVAWVGVYFSVFWCLGGQTPGMKVWHIRVVIPAPCLRLAILRFFGGGLSFLLLGIPFWLAQADSEKRSLIDRVIGSRVVHLPKPTGRTRTDRTTRS